VRYDGGSCCKHVSKEHQQLLTLWQKKGWLLPLCPEVAGGLTVPRPAAEIQGERVKTNMNVDVTEAFSVGANKALKLCLQHNISFALLKQGSPSCGNSLINDGTFASTKVEGMGITARLLHAHGIQVFNESEISSLNQLLVD